ncbi:type II toxin-antitoxin system RelE/ParE family toxin [Rheinheimera sp. YQF-2]|uniref:Type II toxin-antitoxin system RelE/ParE family toxin n=2 Tax=Rheinheimera lutimaris TaxID=2740584 RepID=A0A7Y5AU64_9GAMM|nr:type II toxin-antitoxin system RelE/ParE family toxin [Rheinheimera lutimaris]
MKPVRFMASAEAELLAGIAFYSEQADNLGSRFYQAVFTAVSILNQFPDAGYQLPANFRRVIVKTFPYSVIYKEYPGEIVIFAVAHHRQQPGYWQQP